MSFDFVKLDPTAKTATVLSSLEVAHETPTEMKVEVELAAGQELAIVPQVWAAQHGGECEIERAKSHPRGQIIAMPFLSLDAICSQHHAQLNATRARQITEQGHPQRGGLYDLEQGIIEVVNTSHFVMGAGLVALAAHMGYRQTDGTELAFWVERAEWGIEFLLAQQRPSGLIDQLCCNYDSAPDTAFAAQPLAALLERLRPTCAPEFDHLTQQIELFLHRAAPGLMTGGFHTPNHRWVIAAALAQIHALSPDIEVASTLEPLLDEGLDIDCEGAWTEHSIGVYDGVCDLSMLLLGDFWNYEPAREAARRNLELDLLLLHADGTGETGLSTRQDFGRRMVPNMLAVCFLYSALREPNPRFLAAARHLWESASLLPTNLNWLHYLLQKFGDGSEQMQDCAEASLPTNFSQHLPHNGLWRVRRDLLSATFFRDRINLCALTFGAAELSGLTIFHAYAGTGQFWPEELEATEKGAILRSSGMRYPRRPGYELPLGGAKERPLRLQPPAAAHLEVEEVPGGFDLRFVSANAIKGIAAQIAFDFSPGGVWETEHALFHPTAGQVIILQSDIGRMRFGTDFIEIGPGAKTHSMWQMRDTREPGNRVRVLFSFWTPIDHSFSIRCGRSVGAS